MNFDTNSANIAFSQYRSVIKYAEMFLYRISFDFIWYSAKFFSHRGHRGFHRDHRVFKILCDLCGLFSSVFSAGNKM